MLLTFKNNGQGRDRLELAGTYDMKFGLQIVSLYKLDCELLLYNKLKGQQDKKYA